MGRTCSGLIFCRGGTFAKGATSCCNEVVFLHLQNDIGVRKKILLFLPIINDMTEKTELLKSKAHFQILDGLRGIAALAIVVFHFMEWIYSDSSQNFIGHGFLAVDFFFCLSGFVIGYAYDNRLQKMGLKQFFLARLIRLQPMVILGSGLGLVAFLSDPFVTYQFFYSFGRILLLFICSLLLIPFPSMGERSNNLFGLNAPAWSLFWEYVANILYAFILSKLPRRFLLVLLLPAAFFLFYISYTKGNLLGGWAGENFWDGGVRIWYSFTAGLIIYRYNLIIKNKAGFLGLALLLLLAFLSPHFSFNGIFEACVVAIYFPLIVSLGAGSALKPKTAVLCKFSGDISYPLYMTHYSIIWIFGNYFLKYQPDKTTLTAVVAGGTVMMLFFASLVMKYFDIPVRKYFTKLRMRKV